MFSEMVNGQLAEAPPRILHRSSAKSYETSLNKMWKIKVLNCSVCRWPRFLSLYIAKNWFLYFSFIKVCTCQLPDSSMCWWWFMNIFWTRFGSHRNCYELIKNGCHFKNYSFQNLFVSIVIRTSCLVNGSFTKQPTENLLKQLHEKWLMDLKASNENDWTEQPYFMMLQINKFFFFFFVCVRVCRFQWKKIKYDCNVLCGYMDTV